MQAMQLNRVLAFVEGSMERIFIEQNFRYVRVITIHNGNGWKIDTIVSDVENKFKIQKREYDYIMVWLDREEHPENPEQIEKKFVEMFRKNNIDQSRLLFLIPDQMTENIFLADSEVYSNLIDGIGLTDENFRSYKNGKAAVKELFRRKSINYKETYQGVQLLKKSRVMRFHQRVRGADSLSQAFSFCWWVGP